MVSHTQGHNDAGAAAKNICLGNDSGAPTQPNTNGQITTSVKTITVSRKRDSFIKVTKTTKERCIVSSIINLRVQTVQEEISVKTDQEIHLSTHFHSAPVVVVLIQCVDHDSRCAKHLTQVKQRCCGGLL